MTLLLPLLIAYSLIGEVFHEAAGTVLFFLFVFHHILNRRWILSVFRGTYSGARLFQTALALLLAVFMILQPLSGILMSRHLYTFLPLLPATALARQVHMLLAYWRYVLMCLHAGTHLRAPFRRLKRNGRRAWTVLCLVLGLVSAYGCLSFVKRGFPGYMLAGTAFAFFDYGEPLVFFIGDYLAVMVLFMTAGCLLMEVLSDRKGSAG